MTLAELIPSILFTTIVVLLAIGVVGRPDPSRPRCGRCRYALGGRAAPLANCPGCRADLTRPAAVRFAGHRFRVYPLLVAFALAVLWTAPWLIRELRPGVPVRMIAGVTIEEHVSAVRLEEMLAGPPGPNWRWIDAHLTANAIDATQRRRVAERALSSVESMDADPDILRVIGQLRDLIDDHRVTAALLAAAPMPMATARRTPDGRIEIELTQFGASFTPATSLVRVVAVEATRINAVAHRPRSPDGRLRIFRGDLRLDFDPLDSMPFHLHHDIEIDLVWVVVDDPPRHATEWGLAGGSPELWPGARGARRETLSIELPLVGAVRPMDHTAPRSAPASPAKP